MVHVLAEQKAREAIAAGADGLAHLYLDDSAEIWGIRPSWALGDWLRNIMYS